MRNTSDTIVVKFIKYGHSKISWSQQSNAFDKSRNKEHVIDLLSKLLSSSS